MKTATVELNLEELFAILEAIAVYREFVDQIMIHDGAKDFAEKLSDTLHSADCKCFEVSNKLAMAERRKRK